ncbi:MAG: 3-hydroxyacyl-CoA dehydrogenase, partial [Rhizobiales bacterium]|nr:3-hydroxyacyl-CoA dehydrogenase [Hyphomicrobiales bacterium]
VDGDGDALVTWDMPGKTTNLITMETIDELEALATRFGDDEAIKGVILTSAKDGFCGGADISMLRKLSTLVEQADGDIEGMQALYEGIKRLSDVIRKIETCGKPVVAAMTGTTVGGGYEIALGCHMRIAADVEDARFGLPEGRIGLLPGAGGTQRLSRMIGAGDALQLMLRGTTVKTRQALGSKLIDKVVAPGDLIDEARKWLSEVGTSRQPWDQDKFRIPGGGPYTKNGMMTFSAGNAIYRRETFDNYPGLRALMQAVYEGLLVSIDVGLRIEARLFAHVLRTPEARAMMRSLFVSMRALQAGARRPPDVPDQTPAKIGVLGAGLMGAGITYAAAGAGIDVVLIDRDGSAAEAGKAKSEELISSQVARGRATAAERDELLSRITPSDDFAALADVGLIVEAVFEDRAVKADVTKKAEAVIGEDVVFGSNTSTLPISGLAEASARPENFIGVHFFSPVHRMELVEIIVGEKTSPTALAAALDFVRAIGKTPIVVNDSRGFYTSRVVATYVGEGHAMLGEGVPPAMIENVGQIAGMPVGPLALNDEVGVDLALAISRAAKADLGDAYEAPGDDLLAAMVDAHGRLGRKNAKGFYDYPKNGKKRLWPGLDQVLGEARSADEFSVDVLAQRFLTIQALETARCFEEGVLDDVRDADVGAILGFGFAPFTGGPLSYIDMIGPQVFVQRCENFAKTHGARFKPCKLICDMADKGETFYQRFAPDEKRKSA